MKDKILNFLIIFFLSFFIVNIFFTKKEDTNTWTISFKTVKKSYTIPAAPVLLATNNTQNTVNFNTCKDIIINYSWEKLNFDPSFCRDVELKPNSTEKIEYSKYYTNFLKTWDYNFLIKLDGKEYISQMKIENKWIISKLFVWLFYAPLYNLTIFFIEIFNNSLGWAIITITILIRLVLLYPQHKMMVSQKKMNAVQPKIKEIQEKYKWNPQMLWTEMMNLYKKEKISPFGSCWLLLIQMPIIIVIYNIFINIKDYSNVYYIYDFMWKYNLDSIISNFYGLDLLWAWWVVWIILAISIALLQYLQVKLSLVNNPLSNPKSLVLEKKKDSPNYSNFMPDPNIMNKFMLYWLPAMVWVFTYSLIAWVWIYRWISTLFSIFQQLIVNKKVKK